jgi:hypothetical protein
MIPYHGGPFADPKIAAHLYRGRHAMVSFARPEQLDPVSALARSFALDNGAFSAWRAGSPVRDWPEYYAWVAEWKHHPGFDFAVIPDAIEASEEENDELLAAWPFPDAGVPVYHLHESLERLQRLSRSYPRIALGSSGRYRTPGTLVWWDRMNEVLSVVCDKSGHPQVKLHGLRMLSPKLLAMLPLGSADSTTVARNVNLDRKWRGPMCPATKWGRALSHCERIEAVLPPARWAGFQKPRYVREVQPSLFEPVS